MIKMRVNINTVWRKNLIFQILVLQEEFNINIHQQKISEVLHKKQKSTGGFVFEYV